MSVISDFLKRQVNPVQRQFIDALRAAGATSPDSAVSLERSLAPGTRDLQPLIDAGVVREASRGRYYLYEAATEAFSFDGIPVHISPGPFDPRRLVKAIVFWFILILIPIALLQVLIRR